jgi:hypothetical protein
MRARGAEEGREGTGPSWPAIDEGAIARAAPMATAAALVARVAMLSFTAHPRGSFIA